MRPTTAHVLIALALQGLTMLAVSPLAALLPDRAGPGLLGALCGAFLALGFYLGRERKQSEYWMRDRIIPPWVWHPRALRDVGYPAAAAAGVALILAVLTW